MTKIYHILTAVFLLTFQINLLAQSEKKDFVDENFSLTTEKNAQYIRFIYLDAKGKETGDVIYYYKSGELYTKLDGVIFKGVKNNEINDFNNRFRYYKSGRLKSAEIIYEEEGFVDRMDWLDIHVQHSSYFGIRVLNWIEQLVLTYNYDALSKLAGTNLANVKSNVDFEGLNLIQEDYIFDFVKKDDIESRVYTIGFSDKKEFIGTMGVETILLKNAHQVLLDKGFKLISTKDEKDEKTGRITTRSKWDKTNYPYRIALRSYDDRKVVYFAIVSDLSPLY
ncbi:hypothetical protein FNJ88_01440 [Chryseobacterium sp. SNU WT5]|uniref:hypothetical protein n=1 Tax=Chryseobacterium sp. SNU WT5 TaxID=2594269 RepID=UPI00117DEF90|nr:hypothetical protein [Chryseobacterium sp. SNU WT5]QDP84280.1 hypothetical protein FNJ88_01440 [Chryseobacterium sp. SNU WT5]